MWCLRSRFSPLWGPLFVRGFFVRWFLDVGGAVPSEYMLFQTLPWKGGPRGSCPLGTLLEDVRAQETGLCDFGGWIACRPFGTRYLIGRTLWKGRYGAAVGAGELFGARSACRPFGARFTITVPV
ncbi:hypothetical protein D3C72_611530 [compost metagenome]